MIELIESRWPDIDWDFVMPNELCSGILVQFSLQPELRAVYSELLGAAGKEIILRPASLYSSGAGEKAVTFEQLSVEARARGEVLVGLHREGSAEPMLNPPRDLRVKIKEGDKVVVLGDAF